jgi:hypothetical protein
MLDLFNNFDLLLVILKIQKFKYTNTGLLYRAFYILSYLKLNYYKIQLPLLNIHPYLHHTSITYFLYINTFIIFTKLSSFSLIIQNQSYIHYFYSNHDFEKKYHQIIHLSLTSILYDHTKIYFTLLKMKLLYYKEYLLFPFFPNRAVLPARFI